MAYNPTSTQEAWDNHFTAFGAQNVDQILLDYTEESVLKAFDSTTKQLTTAKGIEEIKAFFANLFNVLSDLSALDAPVVEVTEAPFKQVYLNWSCISSGILQAHDSFYFDDNFKIIRQNIGYTSQPSKPPALPTPSRVNGPFKLTYFPIPGAPGEVQRLLLVLGGYEWSNDTVRGPAWAALKPHSKYGQVPLLTYDSNGKSVVMAQSRAIARFLANGITNADGKPTRRVDTEEAFQIDEYVEALEEARNKIIPTFRIKGREEQLKARAALFATDGSGEMLEGFRRVDELLASGKRSPGFMVGDSFSLADAWAFVIINQFRSGFLDGIPTDGWTDLIPNLMEVVQNVTKMEKVKEYYTKIATQNPLYAVHAGR
jgi:glutathione S-transferase